MGGIYELAPPASNGHLFTEGGVGQFVVPDLAVGVGVLSGVANTYGAFVQLLAATAADIYVLGVLVDWAGVPTLNTRYVQVQLGKGAAGVETVIGVARFAGVANAAYAVTPWPAFYFAAPIPVASGTRLAAKTANNVGAQTPGVTLLCTNQANLS